MDPLVRKARSNDAPAILAILNPIIESGLYTAFDAPLTAGAECRYITGLPERAIFHVAMRKVDETIVGFQSLEPFATYSRAIDQVGVVGTYVDLSFRRRGVAKRLFP